MDTSPPAKRFRRDDNVDPTNPDPSIVVHVRNLSPKATEADLLEALSHFGAISYATCMPNKRMALVEFEELEGARSCVVFAAQNQIYVSGQPALFNYSTSKMIQRLGLESEKPNHVLILTIYNAQYPVNVEVIHQICNPHGDVKRIAMIRRSMLQALVEYPDAETAKKAKHAMNGADIYSGCCTLKVEFAKPDHVKVTRNDSDQFDYTIKSDPNAPPTTPYSEGRKPLIGGERGPPAVGPPPSRGPPSYDNHRGGPPDYHGSYPPRDHRDERDRPPAPAYGRDYDSGYSRAGPGYGPQDDYYDERDYGRGPPPRSRYDSAPRGGYGSRGGRGGYDRYGDRGYGSSRYDDDRGYGSNYPPSSGGSDNSVVMVYGIDHDKFNCDKLFNILCLYGNCLRIKFMKSKPDTAMAQMGNEDEAYTAIKNLHDTTIFGQKISLRPSKQSVLHEIREPFNLPDGTPSFRDYTHSRNQRFSNADSAARNRIVPPTNQLHWYNAPPNMTEDRLQELFREKGGMVPSSVTMFPSKTERSSAGICEFPTTQAASEALMLCNHTPVVCAQGKAPYIVKLAYAGGRDGREFRY